MNSFDNSSDLNTNSSLSNKRRQLLKLLAFSAGVGNTNAFSQEKKEVDEGILIAAEMLSDRVQLTVYRPEDLLELEMVFTGFQMNGDGKSIRKTSSPNLLHVYFSPQSIAEQAFEEGAQPGEMLIDNKQPQNLKGSEKLNYQNQEFQLPAKTFLSEKSRLVFSIPADISLIQLNAEVLLNWDKYTLLVTKRAASPKAMPLFSPDDTVDNFKNILIKDSQQQPDLLEALGPGQQPLTINPDLNNNSKKNNLPKQSELSRRVQLNQNIRSATSSEQQQIQQNELPQGVITNLSQPLVTNFMNLKIGKTPRPLDADETCIEVPFRLFISPNEYGAWYHEHKLKTRTLTEGALSKTVELWHTRLTCKNCTNGKDLSDALRPIRSVRAVWAVDINGDYNEKPQRKDGFKTSLYNDDRHCIVHESSNWALPNKFVPQPVMVNNLMLTTLGAWFDAELSVKRDTLESAGVIGSLNLLKWKHIATMARDHYVEVVYAGNIFPFGHEASLVRITQRRPQKGYAVNRQRYFIAISEEEKKYDPYDKSTGVFRKFNFSTIKIITTSTPTIDPPSIFCNDVRSQSDQQFIPKVNGKDFMFKIMGFDLEGNELHFEMPLVFLTTDITRNSNGRPNEGNINKLANCYNNKFKLGSQVDFRNQQMALARSQTKGDTVFEVKTISFQAILTENDSVGFHPVCKELDIYINAVENLLGKRVSQPVELVDDEQNKTESSRKNKGKVFAKLLKSVEVDYSANTDKIGGGLSPNFSITALSKTLGAIGGEVESAIEGDFDPEKFFAVSAKLFGVIDISKIIKSAKNVAAIINGENIQSPFPALKNIETKEAFVTQYSWSGASLKSHDFGFVKFKPKSGSAGKLKVDTKLKRYKDPTKSTMLTMDSYIDDFSVEVASIAAVNFKRVGFKVDSTAKLDFTVDMAQEPIRFMGALTFINDLQRYIPADGFSDPPFLDVTPAGVLSGYTLGLPDIQLGVFTLRNINLGASIRLPFDGSPMILRFNFCERQQPFTLTVSALGGGGFFALEFDMNGLRSIDAAFEFGAALSLDLGVASGAVSVMGGIYFRMVASDGVSEYELQGYIRINGALTVLGLITVSVEFLLALSAELEKVNGEDKVSRVWGEANLRVKVEVFMFSKTVSMRVQRQFVGAGADPTFGMLISNDEWLEYCEAFAA